jgi:hypothetical protein
VDDSFIAIYEICDAPAMILKLNVYAYPMKKSATNQGNRKCSDGAAPVRSIPFCAAQSLFLLTGTPRVQAIEMPGTKCMRHLGLSC